MKGNFPFFYCVVLPSWKLVLARGAVLSRFPACVVLRSLVLPPPPPPPILRRDPAEQRHPNTPTTVQIATWRYTTAHTSQGATQRPHNTTTHHTSRVQHKHTTHAKHRQHDDKTQLNITVQHITRKQRGMNLRNTPSNTTGQNATWACVTPLNRL